MKRYMIQAGSIVVQWSNHHNHVFWEPVGNLWHRHITPVLLYLILQVHLLPTNYRTFNKKTCDEYYLLVEPTHLKNMLVKLDHFPNFRDEHKKQFKPPANNNPIQWWISYWKWGYSNQLCQFTEKMSFPSSTKNPWVSMGHNFASTEYVMLLHCEVNATLYTSWQSFGVSPPREKWHGVVEMGGE